MAFWAFQHQGGVDFLPKARLISITCYLEFIYFFVFANPCNSGGCVWLIAVENFSRALKTNKICCQV